MNCELKTDFDLNDYCISSGYLEDEDRVFKIVGWSAEYVVTIDRSPYFSYVSYIIQDSCENEFIRREFIRKEKLWPVLTKEEGKIVRELLDKHYLDVYKIPDHPVFDRRCIRAIWPNLVRYYRRKYNPDKPLEIPLFERILDGFNMETIEF